MELEYAQFKQELEGDFTIEHKITASPDQNFFHIHDPFEIMFVLSAGAVCLVADKKYPVPQNSLLIFNNMDLHMFHRNKTSCYDRYMLYFRPEYIEDLSSEQTDLLECFFYRPFEDVHLVPLDENASAQLIPLLERVLECRNAHDASYGQDLRLRFLLGELLLFVNEAYRGYHGISSEGTPSDYRLVYPVINYIHRHLNEDLTLDVLAQNVFLNKHYLCALFKGVTGISPKQYVINCRIMKAKELLSKGVSVEMVGRQVGYNNLSHFSRSFKQHAGLSPKKYAMQFDLD